MIPLLQLPRIHFDFGVVAALPLELKRLGIARPLFVTDANLIGLGVFGQARAALPEPGAGAVFSDVPENPTVAAAQACHAAFRAGDCDGLVAVGGGSVIDCAKAAAVLATHPDPLAHYLGRPDRIVTAPAPLIALPTTAGTGSEVSRGCGIHPDATSRGLGLNHPLVVPLVAICDPQLTMNLPPRMTAGSGLDALSHCIEGYLATPDNALVDAIALDGAGRLVRFIERAVRDGADREARREVMMAALEGGVSIYKGLGPAHAIANTCGDRGLHHGLLTTIALPHVLRLYEAQGLARLKPLASALGCEDGASVADFVAELNARLGAPATIRELGYANADLDDVAQDACNSFFNRSAPYRPTLEEFRDVCGALV